MKITENFCGMNRSRYPRMKDMKAKRVIVWNE
jgi:hypothetical protein